MIPVKFVVLVIMDGWGIAPPGSGNAISLSKTPNIDNLTANFPHTELVASGEGVGLPKGEMGNTETGHLNLGAGHIVYQDLPRINMSIADGRFFQNSELLGAIDWAKSNKSRLHLIGLIGAGGVHANPEHLYALLRLCAQKNFKDVFLHLITDGRDSSPTSALMYLSQVKEEMKEIGVGTIATIMGRYLAMDRDFRWDRIAKAYWALVKGVGNHFQTPEAAIQASYNKKVTDEFIEPCTMVDDNGNPIALISDNDSVIFYNYRIDRPRELTKAFVLENFESEANSLWSFDPFNIKYSKSHLTKPASVTMMEPFLRGPGLKNLYFVTMTKYGEGIPTHIAFPPEIVKLPLGRVISDQGLRQLRVAESEKERFVTFYFNGQRESPYPGEDRLIIPSPKVATYDLKPEMSAYELTEEVTSQITQNQYELIILNFANPDMVSHTGVIPATVKACEVVDECVGSVVKATQAVGGTVVITADHGNAEEMINAKTGEVDTEHSDYPVPFIVVGVTPDPKILPSGVLADVAPTMLYLLGIQIPPQMSGRNLLKPDN
jgi:2,3-bisphosphoglycerate-independent phosphoglycerate mutase